MENKIPYGATPASRDPRERVRDQGILDPAAERTAADADLFDHDRLAGAARKIAPITPLSESRSRRLTATLLYSGSAMRRATSASVKRKKLVLN
jgi:hypothetical protein